jgi:uncharacterized membrane protein YoaK (UPF0700 family)
MFRHQGPDRTARQNGLLAGYLALIGGFVNTAGFVLIGSFTSHVTGNVGRFANDILAHQFRAAAAALLMIGAFFAGAFVASLIIESNYFLRTPTAYAVALLSEALLLGLFIATADVRFIPRLADMAATLLCAAMGMQNSLVTRLSGAVVRTTHLTGVVTDMGIEVARWCRWWHASWFADAPSQRPPGRNPAQCPGSTKVRLLATIASAFTLGSVAGGLAASVLHQNAMFLPSAAVALAAAYAFKTGAKASGTTIPPSARSTSH